MKKILLLVLAICALTPWTWTIIIKNLYIGFIVLSATFAFSVSNLINNKYKKLAILKNILLASIFILSILMFLDRNRYSNTDEEVITNSFRHEFYAVELGKIYRNRFGIFYFNNLHLLLREYTDNLYPLININNYFNTDMTKTKFLYIFLPLLFIGIYSTLVETKDRRLLVTLFIIFSFGILDTRREIGPFFLYPFLIYFIAKGTIGLLKILHVKYYEKI